MRTGDKEKEIIANLSRYVDHLCEDALEHNTPLFDDNHTSIYSILDILNEIANDGLDDEVDRISLHAIHDELRNLSSHRCERMASSRQRMPHTQWFNLEFLAVLILIGFLMIDLTSAAIEALLFALSTGSISVLMLVIHDLDDPFNGIFRIDNSPYLELREEFSKTLNEVTLE
jgi:hypothetical protein